MAAIIFSSMAQVMLTAVKKHSAYLGLKEICSPPEKSILDWRRSLLEMFDTFGLPLLEIYMTAGAKHGRRKEIKHFFHQST